MPLEDVPEADVLSVLETPDVLEPVAPEDRPLDVPDEPVADGAVPVADGAAVPLRSSVDGFGFIVVALGSFGPAVDGAPPAEVEPVCAEAIPMAAISDAAAAAMVKLLGSLLMSISCCR